MGRLYSSEAEVMVNGKKSKAMADQITTASKERFKGILGTVSQDGLKAIEKAVKIQLGIKEMPPLFSPFEC